MTISYNAAFAALFVQLAVDRQKYCVLGDALHGTDTHQRSERMQTGEYGHPLLVIEPQTATHRNTFCRCFDDKIDCPALSFSMRASMTVHR